MTNNKKNIVWILCISVIMNIFFIKDKIDQIHNNNRFIKYNFSSIVYLVMDTLEDLDEKLVDGDHLKVVNNEDIRKVLSQAEDEIYRLNRAIGKYNLINSNYKSTKLSLYELEKYIGRLEDLLVEEDGRLTESEINTLKEVFDLTKEYGDIFMTDYYDTTKYFPKQISLPDRTANFFNEISQICKQANDRLKKRMK